MLTKKYNYKNKVVTLRGNNVLNSMRYGRNWKVNKVNKSKKTKTGKTGKKSLMRGGSTAPSKLSGLPFRPRSVTIVKAQELTHFYTAISLAFDTDILYSDPIIVENRIENTKITSKAKTFRDDEIKKFNTNLAQTFIPINIKEKKEFYNLHLPELLKAIYKYLRTNTDEIQSLDGKKNAESNKKTIYKYKIKGKQYELICGLQHIPIPNNENKHYLTFILKLSDLDISQEAHKEAQTFTYIHVNSVSLYYFNKTESLGSKDSFVIKQIKFINNNTKNIISYNVSTTKFNNSEISINNKSAYKDQSIIIYNYTQFIKNNKKTILNNNMIIDNTWEYNISNDQDEIENLTYLSDIQIDNNQQWVVTNAPQPGIYNNPPPSGI